MEFHIVRENGIKIMLSLDTTDSIGINIIVLIREIRVIRQKRKGWVMRYRFVMVLNLCLF